VDSERELRTELIRALDAVAPPAPWLRATVHAKLRQKKQRGGLIVARRSRLISVRRAGALAAALAVVLLVATLLTGGHVWQDWVHFQTGSAPSGREIEAELRARPILLPVVAPDAECPSTPTTTIDYATYYGAGPVYALGGSPTTTDWGTYFAVTYMTDSKYKGLVLIRIRDLMSDRHGVFVGPHAAGDVVGVDTLNGKSVQQHAELILDASHPQARSGNNKWGLWAVQQGISLGWSHCVGIQIDGVGFTEVITAAG
jgi:hypothetical protein